MWRALFSPHTSSLAPSHPTSIFFKPKPGAQTTSPQRVNTWRVTRNPLPGRHWLLSPSYRKLKMKLSLRTPHSLRYPR
ncbi:hypothetical protein OPQ81_006949 [Rhizoctonia solani]|nr:hypothetical protein OPQ81_006949 [Rhizoctonia solani]